MLCDPFGLDHSATARCYPHLSLCGANYFFLELDHSASQPFIWSVRAASFFFGVYSWLVKVLGQFSIIYFRVLGLRIGVRVWGRVRVGVRVRVWVRVRVRVSVVLLSG